MYKKNRCMLCKQTHEELAEGELALDKLSKTFSLRIIVRFHKVF